MRKHLLLLTSMSLMACTSTAPQKEVFETNSVKQFVIETARAQTNYFGKKRLDDRVVSKSYEEGFELTGFWVVLDTKKYIQDFPEAVKKYCTDKGNTVVDAGIGIHCANQDGLNLFSVRLDMPDYRLNYSGQQQFQANRTYVTVFENTKTLNAEDYQKLLTWATTTMNQYWQSNN